MLKIIRSDFYRLFKGKALYLTMAALAIISISIPLIANGLFGDGAKADVVSGFGSIKRAIGGPEVLIFLMLPLIITLITTDFSDGTIKNIVSSGVGRIKFLTSKVVSLSIISFTLLVVALGLNFTASSVLNSVGSVSELGSISNFLIAFGLQLLMFIGIASAGTALAYITQSGSATIAIYLLVASLSGTIFTLLVKFTNEDFINNFNYVSRMKTLASTAISTNTVMWCVGLGLGLIAASMIAGTMRFRRCGIK